VHAEQLGEEAALGAGHHARPENAEHEPEREQSGLSTIDE